MASMPAQVVYAGPPLGGPAPQQERLPSIRDLDFIYDSGQSSSARPRQQQQPQQGEQPGASSQSQSQSHAPRGRPQTTPAWAGASASQQAAAMPPPPSPASEYHHHSTPSAASTPAPKHEPLYMGAGAPAPGGSGHLQGHHKRPRSESTASASASSAAGRSPHSAYPPNQYAAHPQGAFSSAPPPPPAHHPSAPGPPPQQPHPQSHPGAPFAQQQQQPQPGYQGYAQHYAQQQPPVHRAPQMAHAPEHWQHPHAPQYQHQHHPQHQQHHPAHPPHHQPPPLQPQPQPQSHSHSQSQPQPQSQPQSIPPPPPAHQPHAPHPHSQHPHPHHPSHQHPQHTQPPPLQHQPPPGYQQPQQQASLTRTTAVIPTPVETGRTEFGNALPTSEAEKAALRQSCIPRIHEHCMTLYSFANRYAQLQQTSPHVQPTATEIAEMSQRAALVIRLIEDLRRLSLPDEDLAKDEMMDSAAQTEGRPPKRPWEEMSPEEDSPGAGDALSQPPHPHYAGGGEKGVGAGQTMAEKDMAIIRSKRATNAAAAGPNLPKGKYRKRSRATPPGKCHSCNIRETPEWRRGPDGARTLCNACGLHYAKLMRKRGKGGDGEPAHIDLETLRASTRLANEKENAQQEEPLQDAHAQPERSPPGLHAHALSPQEQPKPLAHQQAYAYAQHTPALGGGDALQPHGERAAVGQVWGGQAARAYAPEHQSFLRTAHPPSNARSSTA